MMHLLWRGVKILVTPLGHPEYVSHQLRLVREHQHILLDRILDLPDVQSACGSVVALRSRPCKLLHQGGSARAVPGVRQFPTTRHCGGVCQQCWGCHQHCATRVFVTRFPFRWLFCMDGMAERKSDRHSSVLGPVGATR